MASYERPRALRSRSLYKEEAKTEIVVVAAIAELEELVTISFTLVVKCALLLPAFTTGAKAKDKVKEAANTIGKTVFLTVYF